MSSLSAPIRHAALLLHAMPQSDREWLLGQLLPSEQYALQALLAELQALGVPAERTLLATLAPAPLTAAAGPSVPGPFDLQRQTALVDSDPQHHDGIAALLAAEPPALVAALLAMADWPWRAAVLARLDGDRRRQVLARLRQGGPFAPRVQERGLDMLFATLQEGLAGRPVAPLPIPPRHDGRWARLLRGWQRLRTVIAGHGTRKGAA